jgi:hypothetical protein
MPAADPHWAFRTGVVSAFTRALSTIPAWPRRSASSMSWATRRVCVQVWSESQRYIKQPVFQFGVRHLRPDLLPAAVIDHGTSFPHPRPGSTRVVSDNAV